ILCMWFLYRQMGTSTQTDARRVAVYAGHVSSVSLKNILHFHQLFTTGRFARFDYGAIGNQEMYGQSEAPEYDLTAIDTENCPIHAIYSLNDLFTPLDGLKQ